MVGLHLTSLHIFARMKFICPFTDQYSFLPLFLLGKHLHRNVRLSHSWFSQMPFYNLCELGVSDIGILFLYNFSYACYCSVIGVAHLVLEVEY